MTAEDQGLTDRIRRLLVGLRGKEVDLRVIVVRESPDLSKLHTNTANSRGFYTDDEWVKKPYGNSKGNRLYPGPRATYFIHVTHLPDQMSVKIRVYVLPNHDWNRLRDVLMRIR
jgi:hypothetical protein